MESEECTLACKQDSHSLSIAIGRMTFSRRWGVSSVLQRARRNSKSFVSRGKFWRTLITLLMILMLDNNPIGNFSVLLRIKADWREYSQMKHLQGDSSLLDLSRRTKENLISLISHINRIDQRSWLVAWELKTGKCTILNIKSLNTLKNIYQRKL